MTPPRKSSLMFLCAMLFSVTLLAQQTTTAPTEPVPDDEATRIDRARYLFKYAVTAIKKGDSVVGEEKLREAAVLVPDNALIWYNLAKVQARNHKLYPAVESVNRALTLGLSGEDHAAAEDLQIELTYALSKPPKEPRILANTAWFTVDAPKGPTTRSLLVEGQHAALARSLLRALTPDSQIMLRGEPSFPPGDLAGIPNCPASAPPKMNPNQYTALRTQWYQCVESQVRMHAERIRDNLRRSGFDGYVVLALEGRQSKRPPENPTVSGTAFLVSKEGQFSKVENISASGVTAETLGNVLAERNSPALKTAARSVKLLEIQ